MFVDVNRANPHDSTSVPSCLRCHAEHTIPLSAPVRQANLRYCYNCHHTEEFISCNSCHE
jgi:predicted CXXCH cytochrome family protein